MEQRLFRKELVFGVVLLLIAICIIPTISGNLKNNPVQIETEKNKESEHVLVDPPGIEWLQLYGGSETDNARSVKQTNDGGYIFTGDTYSYGQYGKDAWLCKTDAYGNVLWNYVFGESGDSKTDFGHDVILTSDGGYAFTGQTRSYNVEEEIEIWLVKTDENGIEEWSRTYGRGRGYSVHQTQDGGYIVGGKNQENAGALLLRTDSNGNEMWRNTFWGYPGDQATGWSVDATTDGGFVLTGCLYHSDDEIEDDLFLIKTDADGVELINTTFGGPFIQTSGSSVQQTTDGGFVVCGYHEYASEVSGRAWLIKTDAYCNEQWNQTFNESLNYRSYIADDCKQTSDGGYVLVGRKSPYVDFTDSFLIKTDSNGEKEWELTLEGPQTSTENIYSVDLTQDGGFIAVGTNSGDALLIKIGHIVDISMNKPENALYLLDSKIRNYLFRNPLIIGPVTVEVDASDDEYDIDRVEFYVDGQLMQTDTTMPYSWRWDQLAFFTHTLKAVAYNSNGNVGIEEKTVWKFF